ncbi:hypothetical protein ACFYXS_31205 [Streptomyces sp. NPDC002574]|uniref:hypothetical protein n=1 Tax=Streptomyces sp. NPDC002574 TaxID=3364652 RepID=UPI003680152C
MSMSAARRASAGLAAAAVVVGLAGCQGGDTGTGGKAGALQTRSEAADFIRAAFTKTSEAKSAKVRMTVTTPPGMDDSGTVQVSGVQGWDPAVMDMVVKGSALTDSAPGAPSQVHMVMVDDAMYMDMGAEQAASMGGKHWMKLDFKAAAAASGNAEMQKQMSAGLENMNQDPSEQLALLLESPSLKHLGSEKVGGVQAEHYKGTLTFEEMLDADKSASALSAKQRAEVLANTKKLGIKGYDTEIWVNSEHYPVRMAVGMTMPKGTVKIRADYSDYGAAATVQAPPAKETVDLFKMLGSMKPSGANG